MAGKDKYDWPPDDELVALIIAHGSRAKAAAALGMPRNTLQSRLENHNLIGKIEAAQGKIGVDTDLPPESPVALKERDLEEQIRILKKENTRIIKSLTDQESLFNRFVEASRIDVEPPLVTVAKQNQKLPARSVITPIFDQQFGQFVRPTDTPGNRGEYSVDVFDHRLARWVEGVTGLVRDYAAAHRVEELIIPLGGDQVEGDEIFAGQAWQLELDPCQQVWQLANKMDTALKTVVRFAREEIGVKFIGLYGVDDNHGKVGGKRGGARPATYSWNWLFQKILFDRLRAEPIDQMAAEPGGSLFFRSAGHQFQLIHGHQIRGWGGLPFYGLTKFDGRSIRLHNTIYRYLLMGHHHQTAEIPNGAGETIVSGDWVGANNLSGIINAASRPQQKVLFVAQKWGITETARVYFSEAEEAYAEPQVYGAAA